MVGGQGTGTLTIQDGGTVNSAGGGSVGLSAGSTGTVTVTGPGSSWINGPSGGLNIGSFGTGTLTIANGGRVINITAGPVTIATSAGAIGTLNIGAGAGDPAAAPGTLTAASVAFGAGTGTLNFNHTSTNYVFAPAISGNGSVNVLAGTTILTANNTYTGANQRQWRRADRERLDRVIEPDDGEQRRRTLGSGTVGSTVINSGGFLVPGPVGTPGTMTVTGNLAFQSGAFYVVQVNPTTASTTNVSGTASLAGTVGAIFAPGTYMVRSYPILTAAGGLTGTFDALATSGLPARLPDEPELYRQYRMLNLRAQLVPEPHRRQRRRRRRPRSRPYRGSRLCRHSRLPPLPTFTVNQLNVGHAIDNFFNNGGALPPAFVPLFSLTGNNLTTRWTSFPAKPRPARRRSAFQLTDQFLNLMLDPFVDGRSGVGGADHPALGFAPERDNTPPEIALAYASVFKGTASAGAGL